MSKKQLTHLPTHTGRIASGRIAARGERITCQSCLRQIEFAAGQFPSYVSELERNLQPDYVERTYCSAADRNASLASMAVHYFHLSTFQQSEEN